MLIDIMKQWKGKIKDISIDIMKQWKGKKRHNETKKRKDKGYVNRHTETLERKGKGYVNRRNETMERKEKGYVNRHNETMERKSKTQYLHGQRQSLTINKAPYRIENANMCIGVYDIRYLIVVHSSTTCFKRRQSMRETWTTVNIHHAFSVRLVFILGDPKNEFTQAFIVRENDYHGDIDLFFFFFF